MKYILLLFLLNANLLYSQDEVPDQYKNKNVRIKFKKYERIDLGDLEIKGNIISPGDLSVKQRERRTFNRNLYDRTNFDKENKVDVVNLR
ncbi:MAG: hypothetical protein H6622_12000 [Halobacteriovoraceae bacterium]|nr:hypothetical protein [Halobacteriovoraceae bacterium]